MDGEPADAGGGGADARRVRAVVPAPRGPLPRGRDRRLDRQARVAGVVVARPGGRGDAAGDAVQGELRRLVGGALPRALPRAARRRAVVHLDEEPAAGGGAGVEGAEQGQAPQEARAGAGGGSAAAPGRFDAPLGGGRDVGLDRDAGRRDQRGLFGLLRGRGGHLVEPARGARDGGGARAVRQPVDGPAAATTGTRRRRAARWTSRTRRSSGGRWGSWASR